MGALLGLVQVHILQDYLLLQHLDLLFVVLDQQLHFELCLRSHLRNLIQMLLFYDLHFPLVLCLSLPPVVFLQAAPAQVLLLHFSYLFIQDLDLPVLAFDLFGHPVVFLALLLSSGGSHAPKLRVCNRAGVEAYFLILESQFFQFCL